MAESEGTTAPSRPGSWRYPRRSPMSASNCIVHHGPQLPHEVRSNNLPRVVTLVLQRPENLFGAPAPARSGKLEGAFEWGDGGGRHL